MATQLQRYLKDSGTTQTAFAKKVGLPQSLVSRYASGARRPGLTAALAIERETNGAVPASYWTGAAERRKSTPRQRSRR